jgi:hypothetical protein
MFLTSTDSATDDFVGFVPRSWGLLPGGLGDAGTQVNGAKRSMIHQAQLSGTDDVSRQGGRCTTVTFAKHRRRQNIVVA